MSALVDRQRSEDRRHEAVKKSRERYRKLGRIIDLYEQGKTDAEIGEALGWHPETVRRYRQVLLLALGTSTGGRWWQS